MSSPKDGAAPFRYPDTDAEWQEAVDAAHVSLLIDSNIKYGLMTGPEINVERCEDLLARGKARGIEPSPDAIERLIGGGTGE